MAKHFLKFASWNIEGLLSKIDDSEFISKLHKFDLVSLVETWLPHEKCNINIDGFHSFSKNGFSKFA
jgi:exonuclease III